MLLVALSVIFLINFAIISLLSGVYPRCYYHGDYWSESRYAINVWEGLWIPIPSFVTGIVGRKYQMLQNRNKKKNMFVSRTDDCLWSKPVQEGFSPDLVHPRHSLQPWRIRPTCLVLY